MGVFGPLERLYRAYVMPKEPEQLGASCTKETAAEEQHSKAFGKLQDALQRTTNSLEELRHDQP